MSVDVNRLNLLNTEMKDYLSAKFNSKSQFLWELLNIKSRIEFLQYIHVFGDCLRIQNETSSYHCPLSDLDVH